MSLDIQPKTSGDVITSADFNAIVSAVNANETAINGKQDTEEGKGLSSNDFTTEEKEKLSNIEVGAEVNTVLSVAEKTGNVTLVKNDVGLGNVDNTSDLNKPVSNPTMETLCPRTETTSLTITDAIEHKAINYNIYGNSVQDGTPTPANPLELQSVGDLVTDTEDEHYGKYRVPFAVNNNTVNIYLNEPLRKIGAYADYIDYVSGKVIRKIKAVNIGTFNYDYKQVAGGQATFLTSSFLSNCLLPQSNSYPCVAKCDVYKVTSLSTLVYGPNAPDMAFAIDNTSRLRISNSEYNDTTTFKQAMSSVYLYYAMNLGIEEIIDAPFIRLFNESNTITFGTSVQPSSVKIKYYQDINKVIANLQALILNQ